MAKHPRVMDDQDEDDAAREDSPEPLPAPPQSPPPPSEILAEDGAGPGDEEVWVRTLASPELQRCYAKDARSRQISVGGKMCEHVGEGPDGAWLYEERAF